MSSLRAFDGIRLGVRYASLLLVGAGRRRTAAARGVYRHKGNHPAISGPIVNRKLLLFLLFVPLLVGLTISTAAHARDVTLAWEASTGSDIAGYRLYYGTESYGYSLFVDAGNSTSCTLANLQEGVTYYVAATAYNADDVESGFSNEIRFSIESGAVVSNPSGEPGSGSGDGGQVNAAPASQSDAGGGGGGGGCFIATAAFGSYIDPYVRTLRTFRDLYLLTNSPGRLLVRWYYAASPSIAAVIRESEILRAGVRLALVPVVGFGYLCLATGFGPGVVLVVLSLVVVAWFGGRRFLPKGRPCTPWRQTP